MRRENYMIIHHLIYLSAHGIYPLKRIGWRKGCTAKFFSDIFTKKKKKTKKKKERKNTTFMMSWSTLIDMRGKTFLKFLKACNSCSFIPMCLLEPLALFVIRLRPSHTRSSSHYVRVKPVLHSTWSWLTWANFEHV